MERRMVEDRVIKENDHRQAYFPIIRSYRKKEEKIGSESLIFASNNQLQSKG